MKRDTAVLSLALALWVWRMEGWGRGTARLMLALVVSTTSPPRYKSIAVHNRHQASK